MVRVYARQHFGVQVKAALQCQAFQEVDNHLTWEITQTLPGQLRVHDGIAPSSEVHGHLGKGLVQGHQGRTHTHDRKP